MNFYIRKLGLIENLFHIIHELGGMVGGCFWLGVVTFHEQLFCTFSHVVPLVSSNTAALLVDSVIDTLETGLK